MREASKVWTRADGRKAEEIRELRAELGISKNANGSAKFCMGNTVAIAYVYGPMEVIPKFLEQSEKAILEVNYNMLPFSTEDRKKPGFSRRGAEISAVIRRVFENVIFLEDMPKTKILINIDILNADASTRCASINAASLALASAGIPMKDLVASCASGKVGNHLILDVAGKEDTEGDVDLPIAYLPVTDEILLLQMDGIVSISEFNKLIELAKKGCQQIYEFQKKTLIEFKKGSS